VESSLHATHTSFNPLLFTHVLPYSPNDVNNNRVTLAAARTLAFKQEQALATANTEQMCALRRNRLHAFHPNTRKLILDLVRQFDELVYQALAVFHNYLHNYMANIVFRSQIELTATENSMLFELFTHNEWESKDVVTLDEGCVHQTTCVRIEHQGTQAHAMVQCQPRMMQQATTHRMLTVGGGGWSRPAEQGRCLRCCMRLASPDRCAAF
jgi:hypothetical protein